MSPLDLSLITPEALKAWLLYFHKTTAALDAKPCADRFFTPDITLQYTNTPIITGVESVIKFFDTAFRALDSMTHEILYFDFVAPNKLYQAAKIRYVVKGDDPDKDAIEIPAMMVVWLSEDGGRLKMRRNEIYADVGSLFGRMTDKGLV